MVGMAMTEIVGGLGDDTISGGAGNDYVLAQGGDDTISTGTGTDEVLGGSGDDVITIDGAGNKTIDGGTGTDSIAINLSGHTSLTDFGISYASDTFTFTDKSSNTISLKNLETYSIGSNSYVQWSDSGSTQVMVAQVIHFGGQLKSYYMGILVVYFMPKNLLTVAHLSLACPHQTI